MLKRNSSKNPDKKKFSKFFNDYIIIFNIMIIYNRTIQSYPQSILILISEERMRKSE